MKSTQMETMATVAAATRPNQPFYKLLSSVEEKCHHSQPLTAAVSRTGGGQDARRIYEALHAKTIEMEVECSLVLLRAFLRSP
jgi:hypothetical protein